MPIPLLLCAFSFGRVKETNNHTTVLHTTDIQREKIINVARLREPQCLEGNPGPYTSHRTSELEFYLGGYQLTGLSPSALTVTTDHVSFHQQLQWVGCGAIKEKNPYLEFQLDRPPLHCPWGK